ncbi:hypothetical protein SLEP1_g12747 [Rubroshorea leprosula]|uniref:Uncharacterized protein n=1 Tax=Rubroshorea leprosula TaxID=152421 RepID=A0AAV5IPV9_9ROSI|nr:hypothetical protein SLEP1_g12747 [Rubroshorea leprosula]
MGNEGHSGSESMPSLGDAAPQTWGAGPSVTQHDKVGIQPPQQQLKRKPGEIGEPGLRDRKKRSDKAYREKMKQEKLTIKDELAKLTAKCEQLEANLKGITDEKQKLELLAENQRLRLEKQHSDEIRSLEKQHSDEIIRLGKEHFNEIRSLQKQLSDAIVKKEQSDYEIKSLRRELDEEKKKVLELSAFNNWKTEVSVSLL